MQINQQKKLVLEKSTGNIRMRKPEARTFPLPGFDSNLSTHPFDQTLADG